MTGVEGGSKNQQKQKKIEHHTFHKVNAGWNDVAGEWGHHSHRPNALENVVQSHACRVSDWNGIRHVEILGANFKVLMDGLERTT